MVANGSELCHGMLVARSRGLVGWMAMGPLLEKLADGDSIQVSRRGALSLLDDRAGFPTAQGIEPSPHERDEP